MSKLILSCFIFIGYLFSQEACSCEDAWRSNQNSKKKKLHSPKSAKEIFTELYTKIEDIIPNIKISELEILPETDSFIYNRYNKHRDNQYYKTAKWRGKKVFLKKIKDSNGEYEMAVLRTLNRIGIPTLFIGTVRNTDGVLYMVSKFQESEVFRAREDFLTRLDPQYHQSVLQQLDRIGFLLSANNITQVDTQFLVSDGKVYIIDVEHFVFPDHEETRGPSLF